jgi:hypothetical protein
MIGISTEDVRDLLIGFAAAIELDQIRVDAMPAETFHREYDDGMWRRWRRKHLEYIDQLLVTVPAMPSAMLNDLTRVAITYEPVVIGQIAHELFADAASGNLPEDGLGTAVLFFGWLIKNACGKPQAKSINSDARAQMMQWFPVSDPLRISIDPECGYGQPAGFVN